MSTPLLVSLLLRELDPVPVTHRQISAFLKRTSVHVREAPEMLRLAEQTLGPLRDHIELVEGSIDDAPPGPFDAAICLLTLHFLPPAERTRTVCAIRDRLRPGAPIVAAHGSFPQEPTARELWLDQYAAFALASGADADQVAAARAAVAASGTMIAPEQDEAVLREGGFADITLFYAAFTWRGWIAHA